MKKTNFTAYSLNPGKDRDALLVLMISLIILILSAGLFFIGLTLLVFQKAINTSAGEQHPENIFLVFGKKLIDGKPDPDYRARLERLLNSCFHSAILMGGTTGSCNISEAKAGLHYLPTAAIKGKIVRLEEKSTNTLENLKNTRQLLGQQSIIIISNRYHLARCSALASSLGIPHRLCAAEHKFRYNITNIVQCLREAFYLHWFFSGRYWAKLTRNQRMLEKIS